MAAEGADHHHMAIESSRSDEAADNEGIETTEVEIKNQVNLKDRKVSWAKLRRVDSLNLEAGRISGRTTHGHASKVCDINIYI